MTCLEGKRKFWIIILNSEFETGFRSNSIYSRRNLLYYANRDAEAVIDDLSRNAPH